MGDGSDLLKYMTNRVATYLTTPQASARSKSNRLPWTTRWFGMVPMGMQLWWEDKRGKSSRREAEPNYDNILSE